MTNTTPRKSAVKWRQAGRKLFRTGILLRQTDIGLSAKDIHEAHEIRHHLPFR